MFEIKKEFTDFDVGIEKNALNPYPSLYIKLRLLTDIEDPSGQKYYPDGCTALKTGTTNIKMDYEHNGYFAMKSGQKLLSEKISNAGEIIKLEVVKEGEIKALYGTARVGVEHKLMTKDGVVVGSSYASLWQLYAQKQVYKNGGNIYNYIPENINKEFFDGQDILPIKSISVEVPFLHYKTANYQDLNGLLHIKMFDLPRVAFLGFSSEGQPLSQIGEIEIKKKDGIKKENIIIHELEEIQAINSPPMVEAKNILKNQNQITMNEIKCLCEAQIGQTVIKADRVFEVVTMDNANHRYEIKDAVSDETIIVETEEEAGTYEVTDEIVTNPETTDETKSFIKACQSCIEKKKKMEEMQKLLAKKPVKTDETTLTNNNIEPYTNMQDIMDELSKMKDMMASLAEQITSLNITKSEVEGEEAEIDTENTDIEAEDVEEVEEISTPNTNEEYQVEAEIKSMQNNIKPIQFDFNQSNGDTIVFKKIN